MVRQERQLKCQHRIYWGRNTVEGVPSKRTGAHNHLQAWNRYREGVWGGNFAGRENFSGVESTITKGS
jgi:hypothetical protein